MRLIDADKCPCILCEDTRNAHCTYEHRSCEKFCNWINNAAYNVDKVVEELDEQWNDVSCIDDDMYYIGVANGLADAIDIVKRGGVE